MHVKPMTCLRDSGSNINWRSPDAVVRQTTAILANTNMRCIVLSLCVVAVACAGGDDGDGAGQDAVAEDRRSMTEICTTYCQNGADHGCESLLTLGAPTCVESCDIACPCDAAEQPACRTAWKNHSACLADTPNVCDAQVRDDRCLDAYCAMRRACDLPDPKCR